MQFDAKSELITTVHNAIAATVSSADTTAVETKYFNSILVYVVLGSTGTPNWTIDIETSDLQAGTYIDAYDATTLVPTTDDPLQLTTGALTASRCILFSGVGNWVKAVATGNSGTGTCTVKVQPINI